jgi:hypothetical protein
VNSTHGLFFPYILVIFNRQIKRGLNGIKISLLTFDMNQVYNGYIVVLLIKEKERMVLHALNHCPSICVTQMMLRVIWDLHKIKQFFHIFIICN